MDLQWYPGHMTKAKHQMQEDMKWIDLVIELVDARAPIASRNPDIDELAKNRERMILLNKADLADEKGNNLWDSYFSSGGFFSVELDARERDGMKAIRKAIREACREKIERDRKRGIKNRPVRAMVVGIPNVGKSTFINTFAGKACAKTGNRPGITRGKQWIRLDKNAELLDTPGILWPKFDDETVGLRLAWIGSLNNNPANTQELALGLAEYLADAYPDVLRKRYGNRAGCAAGSIGLLAEVAKARNCVRPGGGADLDRAAMLMMDDFRAGRLGRITLEYP